jgi:uncharacterized protein (DUF362 family)
MNNHKVDFVYYIDEVTSYPAAPFNPDFNYKEFVNVFNKFDETNKVYKVIRDLFINSGFDKENLGTHRWNPFRGLIKDGQIAVIKPNLVYEETKELIGEHCLMTHASLIRPVIDYLILLQATDKIKFKIIIADVPIQGANFDIILEQTGLKALKEFYDNSLFQQVEILDLRHKVALREKSGFFTTIEVPGDPLGYTKIHLENSFLLDIEKDYKKFGAPGYGSNETISQIKKTGYHYYHIPNTILRSDLFINIPKVKTHKKAGVTLAMKNLIGINGEKAWIPHYRRGSIKNGGDEYDSSQVFLKSITTKANVLLQGKSKTLWVIGKKINKVFFKRFFRKDLKASSKYNEYEKKALFLVGGDWYGNDTIWRSILDLNFLLFYVNAEGQGLIDKVRKYICLNDGIISGEGDGPLSAEPKKTGIIALSENPVLNDLCFSRIMGFDWERIPQLKHSVELNKYFDFDGSTDKLHLIKSIDTNCVEKVQFEKLPNLKFKPPPGWLYHIELLDEREKY